jgi:hypothetical protein
LAAAVAESLSGKKLEKHRRMKIEQVTKKVCIVYGIIAAAQLMSSGCAPPFGQPYRVALQPKLPYAPTKLSSNDRVYLSVTDQRYSKALGVYLWAPIAASEDIETQIKRSLREGLLDLGFEIIDIPDLSSAHLQIEIRYLKFDWEFGGRFDYLIAAKAVVKRGNNQVLEKDYSKVRAPYDAVLNAESKINAILSDFIEQFLTDLELLNALLPKGQPPLLNHGPAPLVSATNEKPASQSY